MYFALIRLDTSRQLTVLFAKLRSLKKPLLYYIDRGGVSANALASFVNDMTLNETISVICRCDLKCPLVETLQHTKRYQRYCSCVRMILSMDCTTSSISTTGWKSDHIIFTSKLFLGIESDRGRGKIYAKLRRHLVSTRRHTHDKALCFVPCVSGFYLRPTSVCTLWKSMYKRETFLLSICTNYSYQ